MILFALVVAATVLQDSFPFVPDTPPFPDVRRSHWAYQSVQSLKDEGILVGYPSGLMQQAKLDDSPANLKRVFSDLAIACGGSYYSARDEGASRYEAAVTVYAAVERWSHKLELLRTGLPVHGLPVTTWELEPFWDRREVIHAWLSELAPELRSLGLDLPALREKLRGADRETWLLRRKR